MTSANEICRMDAVSLAKQIRTKKLSPVEVVDAVLDRIAKLDPILHAFSTLVPDQAREAAKQTEKAIMAGDEIGSLAGVPIGMKDLFFVKGVRTTFGSYVYKDFVPDEDDVAVERLRKAAVTILGQTNVPEFGYSGVGHNPIFETTRSPWNTNSRLLVAPVQAQQLLLRLAWALFRSEPMEAARSGYRHRFLVSTPLNLLTDEFLHTRVSATSGSPAPLRGKHLYISAP